MGGRGQPSVLVVVWEFPVPYETFVAGHLEGMLDRGWEVSLCCVRLDDELLGASGDLRHRLHGLFALGSDVDAASWPTRLRRLWAAGEARWWRSPTVRHAATMAPSLRAVIQSLDPDVVHAHFGPNAAAAGLACRGRPTPVIADFHGFDFTSQPQREGWSAYRRLLAGQTLVVNSPFAEERVRAGMGVRPHRVPYGASEAFVAPDRPVWWSEPLRLLFVGRLVPQKGVDLALTALAELFQRRPDVDPHLTILGSGPCRPDLERQAEALGITARVEFVGAVNQDEVVAAMRSHEVLLVPSRRTADGWVEGFGKVAAEGIRSGMAVIASRSGGLPSAVGDAGFLVPPDDAGSIVTTVERLLVEFTPALVRDQTRGDHPTLTDTWDEYDRLCRQLTGRVVPPPRQAA